jgi:hypothetical protein
MKKANKGVSQEYQTPSSLFDDYYGDKLTSANTSFNTSRPQNFEPISSNELNRLFDQFKIKKLSHSNLLNIVEKETKKVHKITKRPQTVYPKFN